MQQTIQLLHGIRPLSPELEQHLRTILRRYDFKKGKVIQKAGAKAKNILFIESGLIGSYSRIKNSRNKKKRAFNWFMKEMDIFISVLSFFRQIRSTDNIIALEDSVCWGITRKELWQTFQLFPEFVWHGFLICADYYCRNVETFESQRRLKPEEIYAMMMEQGNELLNRIDVNIMASYLDISRSTYANIRKDYTERKRSGAAKKGSPKLDNRKRAIGKKKVSG